MTAFSISPMLVDFVVTDEDYAQAEAFAERLATAAKPPEVPPPVWDSRPIDANRCSEATRAMCRGGA